jgi:hypothetical protein
LAFIESQIKQFDKFHEKAAKYAVNAETTSEDPINHAESSRCTIAMLSSVTNNIITLGSKQKTLKIEGLLEKQTGDPAFMSFCSRVSLAIQALSPEPAATTAVNDSHQVQSLISSVSCFINIIHSDQLHPDHRVSVHQGAIRISGRLAQQDRLLALQSKILRAPTV